MCETSTSFQQFGSRILTSCAVSHHIERKWPPSIVIDHSRQPSVGLSVCLCVRLVHCGKTDMDAVWNGRSDAVRLFPLCLRSRLTVDLEFLRVSR